MPRATGAPGSGCTHLELRRAHGVDAAQKIFFRYYLLHGVDVAQQPDRVLYDHDGAGGAVDVRPIAPAALDLGATHVVVEAAVETATGLSGPAGIVVLGADGGAGNLMRGAQGLGGLQSGATA